jgi:hypothetical protein
MAEQATDRPEQLLDWEDARLQPKFVKGFVLVVKGTASYPMKKVWLRPTPVGIAPEEYRGVEVVGIPDDVAVEVLFPWTAEIDADGLSGEKGFVLIGETTREYFPPKES